VPAVIRELIGLGVMATINQSIDYERAEKVAAALEIEVAPAVAPEEDAADAVAQVAADEANLQARPAVVTIMGHVDHGKTSLLDAIRTTNVAAREAGGITQHIGAYQVEIHGQKITFLDTPGHAAFTAMRARGAKATDVAILVVAADDGVQPQTEEAIGHAKAAQVPIIVAINKVDKADAQPDRVKQQLSDKGLIVEEWGGDIVAVNVSAKRKEGIEHLLEMILLVAEMAELKADPTKPAEGVVIEAKIDKARGPLATVLVQDGTLNLQDTVVVGSVVGKVRAMFTESGRRLKKAEPSTPVEILGLEGAPEAGDVMRVAPDERIARQWVEDAKRHQAGSGAAGTAATLEAISANISAGETKELNLVVKTDVHGSVEPITLSLERLTTDKAKVSIVHAAAGSVNEADVLLAQSSHGVILGFNARVEPGAKRLAEMNGVDIRLYSIIYEVIDDVQKALEGLLDPDLVEIVEGHAEVRQVFKIGRTTAIAGCQVLDGRIGRTSMARLVRSRQEVAKGKITSLRRFKDDVREVLQGFECGIGIEGVTDFEAGDVIEAIRTDKVAASL
jgi:translation initiation factor IF-2